MGQLQLLVIHGKSFSFDTVSTLMNDLNAFDSRNCGGLHQNIYVNPFHFDHTPDETLAPTMRTIFGHADTCHSLHSLHSRCVSKYYANELAKTYLTAKSINITLWPTDKIGRSCVCTQPNAQTERHNGAARIGMDWRPDCIQVQLGNFREGFFYN